jgi:type IV pilus assembly protein PilY1
MQSKHLLRIFSVAALFALGIPLQSDAQTTSACNAGDCLVNSAVIQKVQPTGVTTDDRGDISFFSSQSGELPNVVFILDNSTSMYELPYTTLSAFPNALWATEPNPKGSPAGTPGTPNAGTTTDDLKSCHSIPSFEALRDSSGKAYDNTIPGKYAPPDPAFSADTATTKKYFEPEKVYRYLEWNSASPGGSGNGNSSSPITAACQGVGLSSVADSGGPGITQQRRCQDCINEAGYYVKPGTTGARGDVLGTFGAPIAQSPLFGPPSGQSSLAAGSYYYVVTAVFASGAETGPQNEILANPTSTGSITITFGSILDNTKSPTGPATTYRVYRGTAPGGENVFYQITPTFTAGATQFKDTGSSTGRSDGSPPSDFVGSYVFKGNWLNFNPPKFVLARKVLTDFIAAQSNTATPTRITVATYDPAANSGTGRSYPPSPTGLRIPGDGGHLLSRAMAPPCGVTTWLDSSHKPIAAQTDLINLVDAVDFGAAFAPEDTPLAETLFNVGQFLSGSNSVYITQNGFGSTWIKPEFTAPTDGSKPRCKDCQASAVVLITDGNPFGDNNVPAPLRKNAADECAAANNCTADSMQDTNGNQHTLSAIAGMLATTKPPSTTTPPVTDIRPIAITHVIGLGVSSANMPLILKVAAADGQGQAFSATNSAELQQRLADAVASVVTRGTAFSAASVSSLQTGNASAVYVPRFNPAAQSTPIWKGQLLRFNVFNEFSAGPNTDLDGNGRFDDVFLVDKPAGPNVIKNDILHQDPKGNFVRFDNTPAVPIWDAGDKLQGAAGATTFGPCATGKSPPDCRNIFTAVSDGNGGWTTTPFVDTDTANIGPALGLTDAICAQVQAMMNNQATSGFKSPDLSLCQKAVIDWARGQDIFGPNPAVNRNPMLGDIFHSSPIVVDPPVDQFLCQTGLHTQCLSTLFGYNSFAQQSSGSDQTPPVKDASGSPTDPYEQYWQKHKTRERIVVVGANDGMLHAFNGGTATSTTEKQSADGFRQIDYNDGDGTETWAFVPPDQLPRLALMMVNGHQFSLDGDIMVRDVWVDGQPNDMVKAGNTFNNQKQQKQPEEFHTVAVVSERQGGNHFFALDVTDTTNPKMLWMYPLPCSEDEQVFGQTWSQVAPHAPPIGPVLIKGDAGIRRRGVDNTQEVWVAFLNGGHSPWNTRGRALAMVDVFTGKPIFKATYNPDATDAQAAMKFGFSAPVAMVDYNDGDLTATDGFFDTAVVGDEGGQIWTVRFLDPGTVNASTSLVDNWTIGRAFEPATTTTDTVDPRTHQPIYTIASTAVQPNNQTLRAFVGTGDRAHIRSTGGGDCRPDNPAACVTAGCTVTSTATLDNGPNHYTSTYSSAASNSSTSPVVDKPGQATTRVATNACTSGGATQSIQVACPAAFSGSFSETLAFSCSGTGSSRTYTGPDNQFTLPRPDTNLGITSAATQQNFFVGISILTSPVGAPVEPRTFTKLGDASSYDNGRITLADLADVTATTATGSAVTGTMATRDGPGWVFKYGSVDEKTATGATFVNSCLLWSSLAPSQTQPTCGATGSSARTFQADAFTGAPNCAQGFLNTAGYARFTDFHDVSAPPPEAAPIISVSANPGGGRSVKYSMLQVQPSGTSQVNKIDLGGSSELLKLISSVPLTADQHDCRHGTDLTKCP